MTERRTKTDWACFLRDIAAQYPGATRITLVMDNLNTHRPGALYEAFEPAETKALWDRFEFVHTPKQKVEPAQPTQIEFRQTPEPADLQPVQVPVILHVHSRFRRARFNEYYRQVTRSETSVSDTRCRSQVVTSQHTVNTLRHE